MLSHSENSKLKKKVGQKGIKCIFLGYLEHSKTYHFMVIKPNDSYFVHIVATLATKSDKIQENGKSNDKDHFEP